MDSGEVVVAVTVNSPIDIDDGSYNDTGLMFPQMDGTNTYTSLFSGQYKIITIKNRFQNGKFEQVLSLVRYMQNDILKALNTSAVRIGQYNQSTTATTNPRN
jgi:endonuclease/exonuclease/phosphatase (EEP) superfamily protein YafD